MRYFKKQLQPVVLLILFCSSLPLHTIQIYAATAATDSGVVQAVEHTVLTDTPEIEVMTEDTVPSYSNGESEQSVQSEPQASASAEKVPDTDLPELDTALASGSAQPAVITTGSASATIRAQTEVGTQIVTTTSEATAAALVELNPTTVSFHKAATCTDLVSLLDELDITIFDDTTIQQLYQLLVTTGDNSVDLGAIFTGSASGQVQLVHQINTTLIGDCWSYLDMTVFEERTEAIILPSLEAIINKATVAPHASATQSASQTSISVTTTASDVLETILTTTTGNNKASLIQTGTASSTITTIDTLNRSTIGNNWVYLEIYNPQYWLGELIGLNLDFYKTDAVWYYWEQLSPQSTQVPAQTALQSQQADSTAVITVDRQADMHTVIESTVNTGNNKVATEGVVITGDASTNIAIRNNINTTLIGNNWYYASINLFAPFFGNIIFPWSQQQADETDPVDTVEEPKPTTQPLPHAVGGIQISATDTNIPQAKSVATATEYIFTYVLEPYQPYIPQVYSVEPSPEPAVLGARVTDGQLFSPVELACLQDALPQDTSQMSQTGLIGSIFASMQVFLWSILGFALKTT